MATYFYARVSTLQQSADRQTIAAAEFGVKEENIYTDKLSGKDFNRPQYHQMLNKAEKGDLIVISSIDRLGRTYQETLDQWRIITKVKECDICVLDMPLLDTRQKGDLTGALISDIVLALLTYVANAERDHIKQRQKEGISAAKLRGVKFGRPAKRRDPMWYRMLDEVRAGRLSHRGAAKNLGVCHKTFCQWVRAQP
ncbi:MAG: recombinase family protein [Oscillospiraceae bacterium]|jgi:DNA invertase Pin-like site-specific DNA recombinase|nr:recombinase family protein [Oscillospiraceae bacterium]